MPADHTEFRDPLDQTWGCRRLRIEAPVRPRINGRITWCGDPTRLYRRSVWSASYSWRASHTALSRSDPNPDEFGPSKTGNSGEQDQGPKPRANRVAKCSASPTRLI
jgi:hypothetical protein